MKPGWRSEMGADVVDGSVRFRVWAPAASRVDVQVEADGRTRSLRLQPDPQDEGVYVGHLHGLGAGARYRYRLDEGRAYPDPRSRHQPEGVHGPSEVVDPRSFDWTDADWTGLRMDGLVIYELHVGTYTPEGTFEALIDHLPGLRALGVDAVELMPVAEFPGRRNWGYDGVDLFAPSHVYGGPDGLRRLVDAAHSLGLGVILDVVYNHLGPDGNYLRAYSPDYFTRRYQTPWGEALNYDGPNSQHVRRLATDNAAYWVAEYHVDGLRLDATHAMFDATRPHILQEIAVAARNAAGGRHVVVIAESDQNDVRLVDPPDRGGYGLDAVWADDFHHAVHTLVTSERHGYYRDYAGRAADVARCLREGFLHQGQVSRHLGRRRGTKVTDQPATAFVFCLQNHDQVGNRALGERLHHLVGLERYKAALVLLLLAPETPLLFMGQEFAARSPFLYFADHEPALGRLVTAGRREELRRLAPLSDAARGDAIPDPQAKSTFDASCLNHADRQLPGHRGVHRLHRDLLALRARDVVFRTQSRERLSAGGQRNLVWMRSSDGDQERLVLANLDEAEPVAPSSPDLAFALAADWHVLLCTRDRAYDGPGVESSLSPGATLSLASLAVPPACAVVLGR